MSGNTYIEKLLKSFKDRGPRLGEREGRRGGEGEGGIDLHHFQSYA